MNFKGGIVTFFTDKFQEFKEGGLVSLGNFQCICSRIYSMGLEEYSEEILYGLILDEVTNRIAECAGNFEEPLLQGLTVWFETFVLSWLKIIIPFDEDKITEWKERLLKYLIDSFCELRIGELFDVIVDFPESKPCILDLKVFSLIFYCRNVYAINRKKKCWSMFLKKRIIFHIYLVYSTACCMSGQRPRI
jgi:hypothetical protein